MSKKQSPDIVTRIRDLSTQRRDLMSLDPHLIKVEAGHNPRDYSLPENRTHLDSLKASIAELGVQQPLWVRWDGSNKQVILVDGECRLSATLELIAEGYPIKSIPVIQVAAENEASRLIMALTANTGKPLSVWEAGSGFRKLIAFGWSPDDIAKKLGVTVQYINKALELADAPVEMKQMLSTRAVTPQLALQEIRKNGGTKAVANVKAKVEQAKAAGKKTAKAEKHVSANEWEKIGRKIYTSIGHILVAMEVKGSEQYEWLEVGTPLLKKLGLLCNGVKAK